MITIKHRDYTFEALSINITEVDSFENKWSLWAKVNGGNSRKLIDGTLDEVTEYRQAIEFAIEHGHKIFKFEG